MLKIRIVKSSPSSTSKFVQIVLRRGRKTTVIEHIGSGKTDEEVKRLCNIAQQKIEKKTLSAGAKPLFPEMFSGVNVVAKPTGLDETGSTSAKTKIGGKGLRFFEIGDIEIKRVYHNLAYEYLSNYYESLGFNGLKNNLAKDLAIVRIIEPASKIKSIELLSKYFDINYTKNMLFKNLEKIIALKHRAECLAVKYANSKLKFDFSLVFYDVTTLYFECFQSDSLRKCGYSKDNKANQPQIMIGLVVNEDGFPLITQIFEGNTFEGKTMIPIVASLKKKFNMKTLTVVADSAMLSFENMANLKLAGINYIVGARLSNLPQDKIKDISTAINKQENHIFKTQTANGTLLCDYSEKRASKDRSDRNKEVLKAKYQISNPALAVKRHRFVKEETKSVFVLNSVLIEKAEHLEGLKGYYTSLEGVEDSLVIARYKELWHVEKSFRIAKSDLSARPVYLRKRECIEAHILIVFLALCMAKAIELETKKSIKSVVEAMWEILDIEITDKETGQTYLKRMVQNPTPNLKIQDRK